MIDAQPKRVGAGGIPLPPSRHAPARALSIVDRGRPHPIAIAGAGDFVCRDAGPADAEAVLHDPALSLYCLDHDQRRALFVRTTPGVDLTAQPFLFQAQFEHAESLLAVPYEVLHELAARAPFDPSRVVMLYSTGRCGSTLLVRAMAEAGGLTGLSEPDVLTQLVTVDDPERTDLAVTCLRLLCSTMGGRPVVVKPRSFVVELAETLSAAMPEAHTVFLHREPLPWARSSARAFADYDPALSDDPAGMQDGLGVIIPMISAYRARKGRLLSASEVLACQWVSQMVRALALRHRGARLFAIRYEDVTADPQRVMSELFGFCGLSAPGDLGGLLGRDSQEGTTLSREAAGQRIGSLDEAEFTAAVAELWGMTL
ncbi:sulfotransferase [Allorhizocola rhizosphaerae]|uniref:sulfotransferase n=1 Tax=Allorhizocola rhizosphaerae TaxID=1872709 RepID=UPI0013C36F97|nr:sulfotransferase [Allorhizocola rhizosphaerae]